MKSIWKTFVKKFNKALDKMAEENKKSFGSQKLDCCQLNNNTGASQKKQS